MTDMRTAMIRAHQANIDRYCRLLATQLTQNEREYIHKRIVEERAALERWELKSVEADAVIASQAMGRAGGHSAA